MKTLAILLLTALTINTAQAGQRYCAETYEYDQGKRKAHSEEYHFGWLLKKAWQEKDVSINIILGVIAAPILLVIDGGGQIYDLATNYSEDKIADLFKDKTTSNYRYALEKLHEDVSMNISLEKLDDEMNEILDSPTLCTMKQDILLTEEGIAYLEGLSMFAFMTKYKNDPEKRHGFFNNRAHFRMGQWMAPLTKEEFIGQVRNLLSARGYEAVQKEVIPGVGRPY